MSEELHSVESCPSDADSWLRAGIRLNCSNDILGRNLYHCVPNEEKTNLVEFCTQGSIGRIEEGLCLFAYPNRYVDVNDCEQFVSGCPEHSYISNEIYNYPACLEINREAGCYLADPACHPLDQTSLDLTGSSVSYQDGLGNVTSAIPTVTNPAYSNLQDTIIATVTIISLLVLIAIFVGLFFWCRRRRRRRNQEHTRKMQHHLSGLTKPEDKDGNVSDEDEESKLLESTNEKTNDYPSGSKTPEDKDGNISDEVNIANLHFHYSSMAPDPTFAFVGGQMKSPKAESFPPVKPMESPKAVSSPPVRSMKSPEAVLSPPVKPMESPEAVSSPPVKPMKSPEAVSSPPVKPVESQEAVLSPPVKPMESPKAVSSPPVKPMESPEAVSSPPVKPMKSPEYVSSPPVKPMLDDPRITAIINPWYGDYGLYSVSCLGEDQVWTCGNNKIMKLLNAQSKLLSSVQTKSGYEPEDITVTRNGDLVYTDTRDRTVNLVKNKEIRPVITLHGWYPLNIYSTLSDDLLVTMRSDDDEQCKVVRYSGSTETQAIQFDDQRRPLYSYACYISENRNLDICVTDNVAKSVVVVNQSGKFRFKYTGDPSNTGELFYPVGITTDSHSHILTADSDNGRIHILDKDGQFLRYIHNLYTPRGLCVDSRDNLFVAEYVKAKVKKIQYL